MTQWYYADAAGVQQGPVDTETLLALYAATQVDTRTLVWREGLADWQALASVADELGLGLAFPTADAPAADATDLSTAPFAMPSGTADVVYAGFWRRFAANLIDSLIIGMLALPVTLPVGFGLGLALQHGDEGVAPLFASVMVQLALQAFTLLVTAFYFGGFHASRWQASPGKLAVGIKVVRTDGRRLAFGRALGRGFAYYLSLLSLYIGFLMAAFTRRKQALHDMVSDTLVVDRWAFTDSPHLQQRGLDTVTIVILAVYAVFFLLIMGVLVLAFGIGLTTAFH